MTTILNGLLGGLAAGFVAALVVRFVADTPSVPRVAERAVGSSFPSSQSTRAAVRILYGGLAGGALVALELSVLDALAVPPGTGAAFGLAVAWSGLLFALLAVVRRAASPARSVSPSGPCSSFTSSTDSGSASGYGRRGSREGFCRRAGRGTYSSNASTRS